MENRIPGCHFPGGFFFFELHLRGDLGLLIKGPVLPKEVQRRIDGSAQPDLSQQEGLFDEKWPDWLAGAISQSHPLLSACARPPFNGILNTQPFLRFELFF
jgi:hypothetical protein